MVLDANDKPAATILIKVTVPMVRLGLGARVRSIITVAATPSAMAHRNATWPHTPAVP